MCETLDQSYTSTNPSNLFHEKLTNIPKDFIHVYVYAIRDIHKDIYDCINTKTYINLCTKTHIYVYIMCGVYSLRFCLYWQNEIETP